MLHLLVVDDLSAICELVSDIAIDDGYTVATAQNLAEARDQIKKCPPDVILLDINLPDGDGMQFWQTESLQNTQVIFMTAKPTVDLAVNALRSGAVDFLRKPISLRRLRSVLAAVKCSPANANLLRAENCFAKLRGESRAIELLRVHIEKVAPTMATVLLVGESGTGKELAAEAIHLAGPRFEQAFIPVNCGAISKNLIESELFGHEKGSFTGADSDHQGFFHRAQGGTLFLDEITEMPAELQVRLLRVLESGYFTPVGGQQEVKADARIIAATNRNPELAVDAGVLREDLYHRLSVFPLELPPLRDRGDDVILLADYFLAKLNEEHASNKRFGPNFSDILRQHSWPGNIRELKNYIYRSYILADDELSAGLDPFEMVLAPQEGEQVSVPVGMTLAEANREIILETLRLNGGVKKRTAEVLGISTKTLYNKLEEYGYLDEYQTNEAAP